MQSAARINDLHACAEGGPNPGADLEIKQGSPNILINGLPAARVGDLVTCHMSTAPTTIATGAPNVLFNGKPAARMGDSVATGGSICQGSSNVFIGDGQCLISIGDSIQVELGNSCMIYFNCGDDAHSQSSPPPPTTTSHSLSKSSLENGIGIGLMVLGIPLDEIGVGEAMQAGGIALREAAVVAETEAATAAEEAAATEETAAGEKVAEEDSATQTTDKATTPQSPTAGNAKIQKCDATTSEKIDNLLKSASKRNVKKSAKSAQYDKSGGFNQANSDFDDMAQDNPIKDYDDGVRVSFLPDGTNIIVRPISTGGNPTLEIQIPNQQVIKVRYAD